MPGENTYTHTHRNWMEFAIGAADPNQRAKGESAEDDALNDESRGEDIGIEEKRVR